MTQPALTAVDHLVALTNYAQRVDPALSRERAYTEALIAYRRYGMRAEDIPPQPEPPTPKHAPHCVCAECVAPAIDRLKTWAANHIAGLSEQQLAESLARINAAKARRAS